MTPPSPRPSHAQTPAPPSTTPSDGSEPSSCQWHRHHPGRCQHPAQRHSQHHYHHRPASHRGEGNGYRSTNIDTQTYLFLGDVVNQPANPPGWPTGSRQRPAPRLRNGKPPQTAAPPTAQVTQELKNIPSLSIVTDQDNPPPTPPPESIPIQEIMVRLGKDLPHWNSSFLPDTSARMVTPRASKPRWDCGFVVDFPGVKVTRNTLFASFFRDEYGDSKTQVPPLRR